MDIESEVYYKDNNGEIIGANVLIYNDTEDLVEKIIIVEEKCFQNLKDRITSLDNTYLTREQLSEILENTGETTEINATHLNGVNSAGFALRKHTHEEYAPKNHNSTDSKYGLGTSSEYGHCKVRNDLTAPSPVNGEALGAYQGQLLNKRLSAVESTAGTVNDNYTKNSMRLKIGRWRDQAGEDNTELQLNYQTDAIYAKLYCDNPVFDYENRDIILVLNGVPYKRVTNRNGRSEQLNIKLDRGTYVLQAFVKGYDGMNSANTMKLVTVV